MVRSALGRPRGAVALMVEAPSLTPLKKKEEAKLNSPVEKATLGFS
jgi:hypothetical protein